MGNRNDNLVVNLESTDYIVGDRLIDLLVEHGIGVRPRAIKVLAFNPEGLSTHEH